MKLRAFRPLGDLTSRGGPAGGAKRKRASQALCLEALETRVVPSGTPQLLKDVHPGFEGSSSPGQFVEVGGTVFFAASTDALERELWKTDGTAAGTVLVKDIRPGSGGSYPEYLTNFGGTLFFVANNGTNGRELWKSDGTAAGTVLVRDIRPGSASSNPFNLTVLGGRLLFTANAPVGGAELWTSDGTAAGTVLLKDIRPGTAGSTPRYHTLVGKGSLLVINRNWGLRRQLQPHFATPVIRFEHLFTRVAAISRLRMTA